MPMSPRETLVTLGSLPVVAGLAYVPLVYRGVPGDWDSFRMANGLLNSSTAGRPSDSPLQYNRDVPFGYYAMICFYTAILRHNLSLIDPFIRYLNALCAIPRVLPIFIVVKRYWDATAAVVANVQLLFIPAWWNVSLCGHPMTVSILCVFSVLAPLGYRSRPGQYGWLSSIRSGRIAYG
jgi:hypothetical protein